MLYSERVNISMKKKWQTLYTSPPNHFLKIYFFTLKIYISYIMFPLVSYDRYTLYRQDKTAASGKTRGGGICIFEITAGAQYLRKSRAIVYLR
jgi:hypothetical protein